jgi:ribonuclease PH
MNIVMTGSGKLVEIQGTAESSPFTTKKLVDLVTLAKKGIDELISKQKELFKDTPDSIST